MSHAGVGDAAGGPRLARLSARVTATLHSALSSLEVLVHSRVGQFWRPRSPAARLHRRSRQRCGRRRHSSVSSHLHGPQCGGSSIDQIQAPPICQRCSRAGVCPGSGVGGRGGPGTRRVVHLDVDATITMTIPTTGRTRPRPDKDLGAITRCWCSSTAPTSPVVKHCPGWGAWQRGSNAAADHVVVLEQALKQIAERRTVRTPMILPGDGSWCSQIRTVPLHTFTHRLRERRGGVLLRLHRRRPRARRRGDPQPQRQLVSAIKLTAASAAAPAVSQGHQAGWGEGWPAPAPLILPGGAPSPKCLSCSSAP